MQSALISTKVVSLQPVYGEVYSIQHYVMKFVSDLRLVGVFSPGPPVSSSSNNKTLNARLLARVITGSHYT